MASRPRALLAAALCSAALLAVPARAQAPAAPGSSASAAASLPRTLPLRRDEPGPASSLPAWLAGALLLALLAAGGFAIVRRKDGA
ncbi:MAG: hypothetical protein JWP65_3141, partial [Ramlibacter sp.]|nr:hypothetical protein [Ramlibacter sp.]